MSISKAKTMFTIYIELEVYIEVNKHATEKFKGKISPAANDLIKKGIETLKRKAYVKK
ncbi:MAG: hypothetical protein ACTSSH_02020 [Candidatus Heimdallarchaeota archaeon]